MRILFLTTCSSTSSRSQLIRVDRRVWSRSLQTPRIHSKRMISSLEKEQCSSLNVQSWLPAFVVQQFHDLNSSNTYHIYCVSYLFGYNTHPFRNCNLVPAGLVESWFYFHCHDQDPLYFVRDTANDLRAQQAELYTFDISCCWICCGCDKVTRPKTKTQLIC